MTPGAMPGVFLLIARFSSQRICKDLISMHYIKSSFKFIKSNRPARVLIAYSALGVMASVLIPVLSLGFCLAVALILAVKELMVK